MRKTVIVVGAGPCGLVALKELLEAGHDAVAFERSSSLGGVFSSSATYPGLHLTISNWLMAFSDFPDPSRLHYPSAGHYLAYLRRYADHFNLEKSIRYGREVTEAKIAIDGRWSLSIIEDKRLFGMDKVDSLVVATGANHVPKQTPDDLVGFSGRILHSSEYDEAFKLEVKANQLRVLVVGGGESGADQAAELSDLSKNVAVWLRRPIVVGPRYLNKWNEMTQVELNKTQDFPANGFLESVTTNRASAGQNVFLYGLFRRLLWLTPFLLGTLSTMSLEGTTNAQLMNDQAAVVTKNQRMCEAIDDKKLKAIICSKAAAEADSVVFHMRGGKKVSQAFDVILLCTGYQHHFPWLKVPGLNSNPRSWFLHSFPADLGNKLAFVGYARPHQGGIPACAEMLSRYTALILRGDRQLPKSYAQIAARDEMAEKERFHLRPELKTLVDYNAFMESVARRIECEPRLPLQYTILFNLHMLAVVVMAYNWMVSSTVGMSLATAVWLASFVLTLKLGEGVLFKWWIYPHWPVWYRQRGPGANPELLSKTLQQVDIRRRTDINERFLLFLAWLIPTFYLQRLLSFPLFFLRITLEAAGVDGSWAWVGQLAPKQFALHSAEWRFADLFLP